MSSEYDAACEVRDAIQAMDDGGRALDRIANALERLATVNELRFLHDTGVGVDAVYMAAVKEFRETQQRKYEVNA